MQACMQVPTIVLIHTPSGHRNNHMPNGKSSASSSLPQAKPLERVVSDISLLFEDDDLLSSSVQNSCSEPEDFKVEGGIGGTQEPGRFLESHKRLRPGQRNCGADHFPEVFENVLFSVDLPLGRPLPPPPRLPTAKIGEAFRGKYVSPTQFRPSRNSRTLIKTRIINYSILRASTR